MITKLNFYRTPEDWDEMVHWINRHALKERAALLNATGMSWNLACKFYSQIDQNDKLPEQDRML